MFTKFKQKKREMLTKFNLQKHEMLTKFKVTAFLDNYPQQNHPLKFIFF